MQDLLIYSLICWRITYMVTEEQGPWEVFTWLRMRMFYFPWSPLDCFYCTSVWVGGFIAFFTGHYTLWLPVSALAIFMNVVHEKISDGM